MRERLVSIDAARGSAMLFVCLAHFTNSYFFLNGEEELGGILDSIGMIASPTFVTVSGLVVGFLAVTRSASFHRLRHKLLDRGLFLLLVGHLILALAGVVAGKKFAAAFEVIYITDAIAVATMLGPWLVANLRTRSRLLVAGVVFALDWLAVLLWHPGPGIATTVKQSLTGILATGDWGMYALGFPVIPWLAVYLMGTAIGEGIGTHYVAESRKDGHLFLARIGFAGLFFGISVKAVLYVMRHVAPRFVQWHQTLMYFVSSYQKFPPGPVYLSFFGGAGMLLVAGVLEAERRGMQPMLLMQLRQLGAASFFVYVLQYFLYAVVLHTLRLPYTPFWPLILLFSIVLLMGAATAWNSIGGNRFLTVGLAQFLDRRSAKVHDRQ